MKKIKLKDYDCFLHSAYLLGSLDKDEKEFTPKTSLTTCRDGFLNSTHKSFARGESHVEFLLLCENVPKSIPNLLEPFLFFKGLQVKEVKIFKVCPDIKEEERFCFGVYVKFPIELYIDSSIFWVLTEDFRRKICDYSKVHSDGSWYTTWEYQKFVGRITHRIQCLMFAGTIIRTFPEADVVGFNSPHQIWNYTKGVESTLAKGLYRYLVSKDYNWRGFKEYVDASLEGIKIVYEAHPNLRDAMIGSESLTIAQMYELCKNFSLENLKNALARK